MDVMDARPEREILMSLRRILRYMARAGYLTQSRRSEVCKRSFVAAIRGRGRSNSKSAADHGLVIWGPLHTSLERVQIIVSCSAQHWHAEEISGGGWGLSAIKRPHASFLRDSKPA